MAKGDLFFHEPIYRIFFKFKKNYLIKHYLTRYLEYLLKKSAVLLLLYKEFFMNIYVGNLSYSLTEEQLRDLFVEFGEVSSVRVMTDRESGRPKGFGFVEMPNSSQANDAIEALNGKEVMGRKMTVNEARPREDRPKNRDRRPRN